MSKLPPKVPGIDAQLAVREVASADTALQAQKAFERNIDYLADWQIIFADPTDVGSVKLMDVALGDTAMATTIFRGRSLWLMDAPFVRSGGSVAASMSGGTSMFLDSNAASHIRAIAYETAPVAEALKAASLMNTLGPRLQHLNPSLYLYECWRHWDDKTISACRQTLAAVHALSGSGGPLTKDWGVRFRATFHEQSAYMADALIAEFERELHDGLADELSHHMDLMETVLIQTQIIQLSSKKQLPHKLGELVSFMHEKLATFMIRELIACGDILGRNPESRIAQKLNSLQNHPKPFEHLRNCAWDLYIPRALDRLCAVKREQSGLDFYLPEVLTFDADVCGMIRTSRVRALAVHRPTMMNFPFFDGDVAEWVGNRLGPKRMSHLAEHFKPDAFKDRAQRRDPSALQSLLQECREQLAHILRNL